MKLIIMTIVILSCGTLQASVEKKICNKLDDCIKKVANLTDTTYLYEAKIIKDANYLTHNFNLTKENADLFISQLLNTHGYTRVPFGEKGTYKIVNNRDIRYTPTPLYIIGQDKLPFHHDYVQALIKLEHIEAKEIVRSFRPFMSRYGRIMPLENSKKILFQDTAANIHRFIELVKHSDIPLSKEEMKRSKEDEKFYRKLKVIRAKNPQVVFPKK